MQNQTTTQTPLTPARVRDFTPLTRTGALYADLLADIQAKAKQAKASRDAYLGAPYSTETK